MNPCRQARFASRPETIDNPPDNPLFAANSRRPDRRCRRSNNPNRKKDFRTARLGTGNGRERSDHRGFLRPREGFTAGRIAPPSARQRLAGAVAGVRKTERIHPGRLEGWGVDGAGDRGRRGCGRRVSPAPRRRTPPGSRRTARSATSGGVRLRPGSETALTAYCRILQSRAMHPNRIFRRRVEIDSPARARPGVAPNPRLRTNGAFPIRPRRPDPGSGGGHSG